MKFIKGKNLELHSFPKDTDWSWLLNNPEVTGQSQLGAFPLGAYKETDSNNLILAIVVSLGLKKEPIGRVSIENINNINRTGELKVFVDPSYHKKGYAKEACTLVLAHAFNKLNLNRVECGTLDGNEGMKKLAESLGFKNEGVRKGAVFSNGEYVDVYEYGLLRSEYNA
jgi:ribosomal-protein-alanine N-acetyltransferase